MAASFGDDLRKLLLAGIGSVAMTIEKSKKLIDDLVKKGEMTVEQGKDLMDEMVKKGEMTVEQGKVFNEELKHNLKEKVNVTINVEKENDDLLSKLDKLTPEELDQLRRKLAEMESGDEGSGK